MIDEDRTADERRADAMADAWNERCAAGVPAEARAPRDWCEAHFSAVVRLTQPPALFGGRAGHGGGYAGARARGYTAGETRPAR